MDEKLPLQPPEPEYVSAVYVLRVPLTDMRFDEPWELRKYAEKLLEQKLGDSVQMTDLKVKIPGIFSKFFSKLTGRTPKAKLKATIKF